jgi:hypothetical protein
MSKEPGTDSSYIVFVDAADVQVFLDHKRERRCHFSLNKRWHLLLPLFFLSNKPAPLYFSYIEFSDEGCSSHWAGP